MVRQLICISVGLLAIALLGSCNSSPTVPVPPPQATLIQTSVPDADGYVTVSGGPDERYGLDDVALVFNDNTGVGAMTDVEADGGWETRIAAQLNHILVIQIKRDNQISDSVEKTVGE
ncbi:MAG: hypothetical protein JXX29_24415 [Deltaproteobacteria bacterium]|nr:hypothetical protein [Deltaproteobacteria bacterium]MBN2674848.1 hypothetical protein [Deltaproteobacteria bacterium]